MNKNKKMITLITIFVIIDFIIKYLIRSNFKILERVTVIKNFFYITHITNTGGAFGILENNMLFLIIISIIIFGILIKYLRNIELDKINFISYTLIISGLIGNLIDRIFLKGVVDYLSFKIFSYYFPVFNLADTYIVIGIIILIGDEVYERINSRRSK